MGTDLVGVARWGVAEMRLQFSLLRKRQMALPGAVVLQPEKRKSHGRKSRLPFRQDSRPDVQDATHRAGIFAGIQQQKRSGAFPYKGLNLAAAADRLKGCTLFFAKSDRYLCVIHADKMQAARRKCTAIN